LVDGQDGTVSLDQLSYLDRRHAVLFLALVVRGHTEEVQGDEQGDNGYDDKDDLAARPTPPRFAVRWCALFVAMPRQVGHLRVLSLGSGARALLRVAVLRDAVYIP
jgi:hypothetical protein